MRALSELTEKNMLEWLCAVPAFLLAPDLPKEPQIYISQTFLKTFPKKSGLEYCHQSKKRGYMIMSNKSITQGIADGYKKIETGVVDGYKKIENGAVEGFGKVVDKCVEVLFAREGESVEDAKARLSKKEDM